MRPVIVYGAQEQRLAQIGRRFLPQGVRQSPCGKAMKAALFGRACGVPLLLGLVRQVEEIKQLLGGGFKQSAGETVT